jgi:uncharacterized protein YlxW (UPF0749 family)
MLEFIKKRWLYILVIILITIIFVQSYKKSEIKDKLKIIENREKLTQQEINNLQKAKTMLFRQRDSLQTKIDGLKIESVNNKIKRDENIKRMDAFSDNEHFKFFSEWSKELPISNK